MQIRVVIREKKLKIKRKGRRDLVEERIKAELTGAKTSKWRISE